MSSDQSHSDSLSISGVMEPLATGVPTGPPKLPPPLPPKLPSAPPAEAAAAPPVMSPPAVEPPPIESEHEGDDDLQLENEIAAIVTSFKAAKKRSNKTRHAPAQSESATPHAAKDGEHNQADDEELEPEPPRGPLGLLLFKIKEWFLTQGVWWTASTVGHAVVLTTTLFLLSLGVAATKIHSVAPAFEAAGGVDTVIGEPPDIDSFDMQNTSVDPTDLNTNATAAVDATNLRTGGDSSGASDGVAGGGGGGGSGTVSLGASGSGGGGGGGGGLGGVGGSIAGMDLRSAIPSFGRGKQMGEGGGRRRSNAKMGGLVGAGDVGGAVGSIIGGIKREMEGGDLLVVWLIDASISLVDDRQKVAERIEPFFYEIERRGKGMYKLHNAVVAFGQTTVEVVKPTSFSSKITAAIRELPIDGSGLENTMTSVQQVMGEYGKTWKGGMMIVVWTDESGDDILKLEETIYTCRRRNAVVNVVGPTAVLGSERGRHYYVDPPTQLAFLLPIKRGPDTCLPERIFMPYWWDSPLAPWIQDGIVAAHGVPWYGGPHREGILSGVGPYALTRLALETGGQFILLDRKEDKSPYTIETMKRYLPEYESAAQYVKDLNDHPLRKATSEAVQATYSVVNLWPPSTQFLLFRDTHYPFGIRGGGYRVPAQFRELFKQELPKQLAHANASATVIEQALSKLPENGMESEYAAERSPRWRAWYDLTRGRLLAMSIRTLEYKLACEKMWEPGYLSPETNRINFEPATEYLSGSVGEAPAREAFRLLTRCKNENKGTPWEMLADWELKYELGVRVKQIVIPPPKPSPPGKPSPPRPPAPVIKFPSL